LFPPLYCAVLGRHVCHITQTHTFQKILMVVLL